MTTKTNVTRFYWLDILRGLAALSVVLWHWQHFFFDGSWLDMMGKRIDRSHYPLYSILRPLYGQGWRAVELFFTLSGFIFFWLYANKIFERKISFKKYMMLRISRLYPLHILTLFIVIVSQLWLYSLQGSYFVYTDFRFGMFLSNLTLTNSWFSENTTFNGPVWSVSVELLLYIIFYFFCIANFKFWWQVILVIIGGWLLKGTSLDFVGTGLMSFFSGGITYYIFIWLTTHLEKPRRLVIAYTVLPCVLLIAIGIRYVGKIELPMYFFELCLFPLIIVTFALLEVTLGEGIGKKIAFIGDISYSIYLWHFPLQILFVLGTNLLGWSRSVFYSPITLFFYYFILIIISIISYYRFEKPIQNYLRNKWTARYNSKSTSYTIKTT